MRRIALSLALGLAPLAGSCASTPVYGPWVIADYCGNHLSSDTLAWSRTEAPANAQTYRDAAQASGTTDLVPDRAREFWFKAESGEVKYCLTNLQRTSRRDWCDTQFAAWWIFRETDTGLSYSTDGFGVCLT